METSQSANPPTGLHPKPVDEPQVANNNPPTTDAKPKEQPGPRPNKLTLSDFNILGMLGRGAYGEVVLVQKPSTSQLFAMKTIDKIFLAKEKKQYQVFIEKEVLTRLNHPNVIKLFYSFQDKAKLYFVIELLEGGEFGEFLRAHRKLEVKAIKFYAAQILIIIEYLHRNGIAHRDLKPGNLMLTETGHLKVIDFGTAKFFKTGENDDLYERIAQLRRSVDDDINTEEASIKHHSTFVGTAEYVSPELLLESECGRPADLWAFGCIIYEMYHGVTPFREQNEYLTFQKVKAVNYTWAEVDLFSDLQPKQRIRVFRRT
eukprot:TRINITY_DN10016_c0_g1_i24.p1 TRINITY_DN10016_c0_g1~~TRINITY_DN10016_c0_g1_i24.p1  ORF type:complete len:316 (-),score=48.24 TRINITY_DN10016_c0_g1_i24:979-1926(-)